MTVVTSAWQNARGKRHALKRRDDALAALLAMNDQISHGGVLLSMLATSQQQ